MGLALRAEPCRIASRGGPWTSKTDVVVDAAPTRDQLWPMALLQQVVLRWIASRHVLSPVQSSPSNKGFGYYSATFGGSRFRLKFMAHLLGRESRLGQQSLDPRLR